MPQTTSPLLKTKLFVVRPHGRLVARAHLASTMEEIRRRKLTLISAPAGFGKTTLIGTWIERTAIPAAWISLDQTDNDPERFFAYLAGALKMLYPEAGEVVDQALLNGRLPSAEVLMTSLINDITARDEHFALVLDDYHVIDNPALHEAMLFFLEHTPPYVHVILTTRIDPSIPLAKLRGRGDLLEIRAADLRFTVDEAGQFFNETMQLNLDSDDLAALQQKTEGWIAGLQMAALSLQGREDTSRFIADFTGADRYVLDYLLEEVVNRQPPELQRLILSLSILERFNGPLCDAVTGGEGGAELLAQLERANLFLVSLDNRREWYRYHHLFGDLLLHRLQRNDPASIPELHRRASLWFDSERLVFEAITHARASKETELLASLIEKYWLDLTGTGWSSRLLTIFDELPADRIADSPRIGLLRAWSYAMSSRMDDLVPRLEELEELLRRRPEGEDNEQITAQITLIRAIMARDKGDSAGTIEFAERALKTLPERRTGTPGYSWITSHGVIYSLLGDAYHAVGDLRRATTAFERSLQYGRGNNDLQNQLIAILNLAREHLTQGRLSRSTEYLDACSDLIDTSRGMLSYMPLNWEMASKIRFERFELEQAQADAEMAASLVNEHRFGGMLQTNKILLSLEMTRGDWQAAEQRIAAVRGITIPKYWERYTLLMAAMEAEFNLKTGNLRAAEAWAIGRFGENGVAVSPYRQTYFMARDEDILYCQVLIATGEFERADALIAELLARYEATNGLLFGLRAMALRALLLHERGDDDAALDVLESALRLGSTEGIVRPFIREVGNVVPLLALRRRKRQGRFDPLPVGYVRTLYAAADIEDLRGEEIRQPSTEPTPLTARELEILQLLALGYPNKKIAEKLYVSVNTVKTHITNLFGKLDAQNRIEALARAKEAQLL